MGTLGQQTGSLMDGLPPEIAKRVHPDWRKNEADYWAHRNSLLANYRDQWIGFANGKVIVSGKSPVEVFHSAQASGQHPFITCVGHEHEPNRMRRSAFSYDQGYPNEPLPVVTVEFRKQAGNSGHNPLISSWTSSAAACTEPNQRAVTVWRNHARTSQRDRPG